MPLLITYRDTGTGGRDELTAFPAGIGRRAHGNPFFAGELARMIDADPGALPDAVRDTIRVRLDDLPPAGRDVLCVAAVLASQLSVASRAQLLALGMRDNAMQYRLRVGGPWQPLLPGVYLAASGVPTFLQKEMAALLYAGPGSLITGPVALMHHSIRNNGNTDVIDVLIPAERRRESTGFVKLHRTTRIPVRTCSVGPARLALAPRAVADTARLLTNLRDVRAVVADAVQWNSLPDR